MESPLHGNIHTVVTGLPPYILLDRQEVVKGFLKSNIQNEGEAGDRCMEVA